MLNSKLVHRTLLRRRREGLHPIISHSVGSRESIGIKQKQKNGVCSDITTSLGSITITSIIDAQLWTEVRMPTTPFIILNVLYYRQNVPFNFNGQHGFLSTGNRRTTSKLFQHVGIMDYRTYLSSELNQRIKPCISVMISGI